jgi:hypothetical protein
VIVFWSVGSVYRGGGARGPTILVDGKEVEWIPHGFFKVLNVSPGTHRLAARHKGWSGLCEITFEASGGTRYFVEVRPWVEAADQAAYWTAALTLAPLEVIGLGSLAAGAAYEAFESSQNTCGGFTVQLVDEATARPKLAEMWEAR